MTRWLAAAKTAPPPKDKTDKTDETPLASGQNQVSSVSSVLSGGGNPSFQQAGTHHRSPTPRNEAPATILKCDAGPSCEEADRRAATGSASAETHVPNRGEPPVVRDLRRDMKYDPAPRPGDPEAYAEALRVHGPMTYGMAMRVLGWGGTRAGQAETALRAAGRVTLNQDGRAVLTGAQS